jgi:predicted O-methyltransferase YrrM
LVRFMAITLDQVIGLYRQHGEPLARVRERMRRLHRRQFEPWAERSVLHKVAARVATPFGIGPRLHRRRLAQLDDEVCEIVYLLLRSRRPQTVVEISPCHGWSTSWILSALRDNGQGFLHSFDVLDTSRLSVPADLQHGRWQLVVGDVQQRIDAIPAAIDFLFMDSDHSAAFAQWYLQHVLPRVRRGGVVCVDDVFHTGNPASFDGEGRVIVDWLAARGIDYFTCASQKNPSSLNSIKAQKASMGLRRIRPGDGNTTIMFEV